MIPSLFGLFRPPIIRCEKIRLSAFGRNSFGRSLHYTSLHNDDAYRPRGGLRDDWVRGGDGGGSGVRRGGAGPQVRLLLCAAALRECGRERVWRFCTLNLFSLLQNRFSPFPFVLAACCYLRR